MSEKIGCMNCGNISCKNNKKRESKGCGRWKTPEQRILELEEKVGMAERTRDRLISIGFPTFASCKEYAAKLAELEKENAELKAQIEKLIDFVLSKTECCDVCPITDTCINSEGTCPYAGILAKGEEEVTREWLMQFISKEIKEND